MKFANAAITSIFVLVSIASAAAETDPCRDERIDRSDQTAPLHKYPELYDAIDRKNEALALCLINNGADVNEAGYNDWTPISRAAQFGMLRVVEALLAADADPAKPDTFDRVPFEYASMYYEKYARGDYTKGVLGENPEDRISQYLSIVHLLSDS